MEAVSQGIFFLDDYAPNVFGLDVPELVLREAYIMRPDLSPMVGWETGRESEPAFMDMNLHSARDMTEPRVVIYQLDEADPMNPFGLLMAYAELNVNPVLSDFDTFLVGSRGIDYEPLPAEQVQLMAWMLRHTRSIIETPQKSRWTSRWLEVLKSEAERGFFPRVPKYGFGDPTSLGIIQDLIETTIDCGAVRHGAECFNFYFPQELDTKYLVIWEGFESKFGVPWDYVEEPDLRVFLLARAAEGYSFPLNPVWTVRDKGWYEVLSALRQSESAFQLLEAMYPSAGGILDMIDSIHRDFAGGFLDASGNSVIRRTTLTPDDIIGIEVADFAKEQLRKAVRRRWRRIRRAIVQFAMLVKHEEPASPGGADTGCVAGRPL